MELLDYFPTDEEIDAAEAADNLPEGDEDVEHPDTQFSDYPEDEDEKSRYFPDGVI